MAKKKNPPSGEGRIAAEMAALAATNRLTAPSAGVAPSSSGGLSWTSAGGGQFIGGSASNTPGGTSQAGAPAPAAVAPTPDPRPTGGDDKPPQDNRAPRTVVDIVERRQLNGVVQRIRVYSDGSEDILDSRTDKGAGEAAAEIFRAAGLGDAFVNSLMASIDAVYAANIDPSEAQVLSSIYNSQAYKDRFKGNEVIRQRMANGQGRPGDRLLTPKEYIDAENSYRQILQDAQMPEGFYDSPDDFTNFIGNSVSVAELKSRVDTAFDALNYADESVTQSLSRYYNMTKGDLVSYLLDPTRAMPILEGRQTQGAYGMNSRTELQRAYEASKVGGAAARQGLDSDRALSEEIVDLGKSDRAEEAFAAGGAANNDLKRLGSLYGEPLDFKDLVKESLNLSGGVESGKKRRKFASKERAAFGGQGALDKSSLSRSQDV